MKENKYSYQYVLIVFILFFSAQSLRAQTANKPFKDTLDGAFDISYYLYNLHGLLPIISPITEPAVGYGAAAALVYFIPKKTDSIDNKFRMPDIVGLAGGYTENGTWFAGGGYIGFWKKDHIRYRGVLGYGNIRLSYYGEGGSLLENHPMKFSLNSLFFLQQAIFRIGESKFLLGGRYQFGRAKVTVFEEAFLPFIKPRDHDLTNSALGLIGEYESFNNFLSPSKGLRVNLTYDQYLEVIGSDLNYSKFTLFGIYYQPISRFWTAGFRFESQLTAGETPFYMMPFLYMRGVPAMRYQGALTALMETEQEFTFTKRWSLVGFGGYGQAFKSLDNLDKSTAAWNAGAGFRYRIARLLGLKMGIDVARGPEQWAVYIVFGNSWMR